MVVLSVTAEQRISSSISELGKVWIVVKSRR